MCTSCRLRCCRKRASMKPRLSTGEGKCTEALLQGKHMLKVPAREGRRKPKVLPPKGEHKYGMTPQGCPNKGNRKPSCHHTMLRSGANFFISLNTGPKHRP